MTYLLIKCAQTNSRQVTVKYATIDMPPIVQIFTTKPAIVLDSFTKPNTHKIIETSPQQWL